MNSNTQRKVLKILSRDALLKYYLIHDDSKCIFFVERKFNLCCCVLLVENKSNVNIFINALLPL